jgi:glycosyltransferase involved in cell wall biosynthesis
VYVLTASPNYPLGTIYEGHRNGYAFERTGNVAVHRSWIYPRNDVSLLVRTLHYTSFAISSLATGPFVLPILDFLITESPPLFLAPSGYLLAKLRSSHWIMNVSDLWPDSAVDLGMLHDGGLLNLARWIESHSYRKAWLVTGQSAEILESIKIRFPDVATYHLSNGVDVESFKPSGESPPAAIKRSKPDECLFVYAGLHGIAQGLEMVIDACAMTEQTDVAIRTVFVGAGPVKHSLVKKRDNLLLSRVQFIDPLPHQQIPATLAAADAIIVSLTKRIIGAVPSKLYEAMAAGKPVVLVAEGEAATIVKESNCGLVVKPGDVAALADAMRRLAKSPQLRAHLGMNGIKAAREKYNRARIGAQFVEFLEERSPTNCHG